MNRPPLRVIVEYDVPPNEGGRLTAQRREQASNRATPHPFLKLVRRVLPGTPSRKATASDEERLDVDQALSENPR